MPGATASIWTCWCGRCITVVTRTTPWTFICIFSVFFFVREKLIKVIWILIEFVTAKSINERNDKQKTKTKNDLCGVNKTKVFIIKNVCVNKSEKLSLKQKYFFFTFSPSISSVMINKLINSLSSWLLPAECLYVYFMIFFLLLSNFVVLIHYFWIIVSVHWLIFFPFFVSIQFHNTSHVSTRIFRFFFLPQKFSSFQCQWFFFSLFS